MALLYGTQVEIIEQDRLGPFARELLFWWGETQKNKHVSKINYRIIGNDIGTIRESQRFFDRMIAHLILGFGLNYNTKKIESLVLLMASCPLL